MKEKIPTYMDLLWPTLKVLERLGGSASNQEISEELASYLQLSDSILDIPHNPKYGSESAFDNRAGWTRTYLKKIGAADTSARGVWIITEAGRKILTEEEVRKSVKRWIQEYNKEYNKEYTARRKAADKAGGENEDGAISDEKDWTEDLLDILRSMSPKAFEHLCKRVLREAGFTKVEVTGRSGDKGIDGTGVLRLNLLSFHVRFQCKRYSGSVTASDIRDFRGAMSAVVDKGLFITTGRFTKDAEKEAARESALAIDLINGIDFCELLKKFSLGITTETQEIIEPQREFFEGFEKES